MSFTQTIPEGLGRGRDLGQVDERDPLKAPQWMGTHASRPSTVRAEAGENQSKSRADGRLRETATILLESLTSPLV
jgi:hypothetical protein